MINWASAKMRVLPTLLHKGHEISQEEKAVFRNSQKEKNWLSKTAIHWHLLVWNPQELSVKFWIRKRMAWPSGIWEGGGLPFMRNKLRR